MNVAGIVAEYNPFHNGHRYHIERSLAEASADAAVCVMSGNFVQRGEPAIFDKWTRTEMALRNGADVVIEIPVFFCLGDASVYASAAVRMLEGFGGVTHISFGSENGDCDSLMKLADRLVSDSTEISEFTALYAKDGLSWPRARQMAMEKLYADDEEYRNIASCLNGSNDILALEYLKNVSALEAVAVKRIGAMYNDGFNEDAVFQSATGIRKALSDGIDISAAVPSGVAGMIYENGSDNIARSIEQRDARLFDLLRYAVLGSDPENDGHAPQGGEGLENRLRAAVVSCVSTDDLIMMCKSKRYTYTRVSRLLMQILLGIDRNDFAGASPKYLRILGFTDRGRKLIADAKKNGSNTIPFLTNINREAEENDSEYMSQLQLDMHASDIYDLISGKEIYGCSDRVRTPVMI